MGHLKKDFEGPGTTKISVILVFSVNRQILADVIPIKITMIFIMVREILTGITVTSHMPWICAGPVLFNVFINDLGYSVNAEITELAADLKLLMTTTSRAGSKE